MNWKSWMAVTGSALIFGCSSDTLRPIETEPTPMEDAQESTDGGREPEQSLMRPTTVRRGYPVKELPGGVPEAHISTWPRNAFPALPAGIETEEFNVRLTGENVQGADALLFNIRQLRAVANGMELPVTVVEQNVNLAVEGDAPAIARVRVPKNAGEVSFLLELDGFGGYQRGEEGAAVDARAVPIEWSTQLEWLRHRGHTVVHVDVGRSLVPDRDGLRFLPDVQIRH